MKPKVLIDTGFRPRELVFGPEDWAHVQDICDVQWGIDGPIPEDQFDSLRDVEAIVGGWWRYGDLTAWPKLKGFLEVGGGLPRPDKFDYPYAFAQNIRVLSCAPAFGPAVAEMGITLALDAARMVSRTDAEFRTGTEYWSHSSFRGEFTLYGKTIGMIGFGGLAQSLRKLLAPWNPHLLVFDPWMTDAYIASQGAEPVGIDDLLRRSDVTFVLAAPSESNLGLLSREKLALIPDDKVLVLLSRAHLVDFEALTDEVLSGRLRAGIDVFPEEPLSADHRIRTAVNAVLSSHRAGAQVESIRRIGTLVARDLEAILRGLPPREMQSAEPEYLNLRGNV